MTDKIKRAELLARFVHLGQKRQDGEDYIEHPRRMVNEYIKTLWYKLPEKERKEMEFKLFIGEDFPFTPGQTDIICAIWMHDCIEDTNSQYEIRHLIRKSFEPNTFTLVNVLTSISFESYNDYMLEVSKNPEALQIKWLDMIDNTSYDIPPKQWKKYHNACIFLQEKGIEIPPILKVRLKMGYNPSLLKDLTYEQRLQL